MAATQPIRVLLVDDHPIMRDGLQQVLERSGEIEVVGQAGDGVAAVELAESLRPDVVIMDVMMPDMNGVDACRKITAAFPDTRVLMLTAATEVNAAIDALTAGATGYLQKYSGKEDLLAAVKDVAWGKYRIPNEVLHQMFANRRAGLEAADPPEAARLTPRELEVLALFARGRSYAEIAEERGNRPLTVRNAIYTIREKLGVSSTQEMVLWAVRNGVVDPDGDR